MWSKPTTWPMIWQWSNPSNTINFHLFKFHLVVEEAIISTYSYINTNTNNNNSNEVNKDYNEINLIIWSILLALIFSMKALKYNSTQLRTSMNKSLKPLIETFMKSSLYNFYLWLEFVDQLHKLTVYTLINYCSWPLKFLFSFILA